MVPKIWVVMFITDWNLPRYLGKTCCVQKCKRNRYQEFGHSGILRTCGDDDFYKKKLQ